jgi:hypothetical protein
MYINTIITKEEKKKEKKKICYKYRKKSYFIK